MGAEPYIFQFVAGFALVAIACGLVMVGHHSIRRAAASETWPAVQGLVVESTVAAFNDGRGQRFRPVVRYRYTVGGRRHEGSRIAWGGMEDFRRYTGARRFLDGYRAGGHTTVHYDPRRPDLAVLRPGRSAGMPPVRVMTAMAATYALFCVGFALVAI